MKSSILCTFLAVFCISFGGQLASAQLPAGLDLGALPLSGLLDLLLGLVPVILGLLGGLKLDGILGDLSKQISSALASLLTAVLGIVKSLKSTLNGLPDLLGGVFDALDGVVSGLLGGILKSIPVAGPLLDNLTTGLNLFKTLKGLTGALVGIATSVVDAAIKTIAGLIVTLCGLVGQLTSGLFNNLSVPAPLNVVTDILAKVTIVGDVCDAINSALADV